MALIPNWSRIINIKFLSASNNPQVINNIICPLTGRKPNIEIQGQISTDNILPSFNIKIKNLYFENLSQQYGNIRVEAGYRNQVKVAFTGSIISIFPEEPSPEGTVVIQCIGGNMEHWLDEYININLPERFTLKEAITTLTQKLQLESPDIDISVVAKSSNVPLQIQAKATTIINELKRIFSDVEIIAYSNKISVWPKKAQPMKLPRELNYLSAPPQLIAGEDKNALAWITAPWDPNLRPGDLVKINQNVFSIKNTLAKPSDTGTYVIQTIDFHFSTVGKINRMTILGAAV